MSIVRPGPATDRLAFGPFEVDLGQEEVYRGGACIRLSGQPFQILGILLERPGELVTREDLRDQIWKDGTFVDFEHGLNAGINKLRRALEDSSENPRYIATVPGRGYRFIAHLERRSSNGSPSPLLSPHIVPHVVASGGARPLAGTLPWSTACQIGLAGILLGGSLASLVVYRKSVPPPPPAVVQFTIPPPSGAIFTPPIARQAFAISPDGTRLAFTATESGGTRVWIRDLSSLEQHPLGGTEGAWSLFWSPDSRSIFYSVQRTLKQTSLETSFTRTFPTPTMMISGSWRTAEDLLVYLGPIESLEISTTTGTSASLPGADLRWAQFLPGTDQFIHVVYDPRLAHYRAFVSDFTNRNATPLMETDSRVQYAAPLHAGEPGHLLFLRNGTLFAQPFDVAHLRLLKNPEPLAPNIVYFSASATACFSVSNTGVLVYQSGFPLSELRWYDRTGRVVAATPPAPFSGPVRVSPDGRQAAADVWSPESGSRDIVTFDEGGRQIRRVTYPPGIHIRPVWSPDGQHLAFAASKTAGPRLASISAVEGSSEAPFLTGPIAEKHAAEQIEIPTDWSHGGRYIAYDTSLGEEERAVWLLDIPGQRVVPLLQSGSSHWGAAFAAGDRRIAFISDTSGRPEVYVQTFSTLPEPHVTGERQQISRNGGWLVRWRADGRELFYLGLDSKLYVVTMQDGTMVGMPKALFQIPGKPQFGTPTDIQFDVAPGGQRFAVTTAGNVAPPDFTVIQNWQGKLRR